jgi:hypothetical protein
LLCCVTVAARVVPDSEGAEASLGDVLAAPLDANREMARLAAVLREENARRGPTYVITHTPTGSESALNGPRYDESWGGHKHTGTDPEKP